MGTFPNQIKLRKSIPTSAWYSGSGDTTIYVHAEEININTKKSLIKINQSQSSNNQSSNPSDKSKSYILDLKRVEDTIKVRGWIVDETGETAWNKAWKLRAMCASGSIGSDKGALTEFVLDNVTFGSGTQRAFLEDVTFTARPGGGVNNLTDNAGNSVGRIEVSLSLYIGDPK